MKNHPLSALIFDFTIYPRGSVDSHHVSEISVAIEAHAPMPPLVIDAKSKRVVDGFHRGRAYRQLFGEEHSVECVEKRYASDGDMLLDAMRYNASHGRALTQHDKAHCLLLADRFSIAHESVLQALNLTPERMGELRTGRIGSAGGRPIALKHTIQHMSGRELTKAQTAANEKLGGMNQMFYVNQLIMLVENDLLDRSNGNLMDAVRRLDELLHSALRTKAA